jgi:hypothetical protein
MTLTPHLRPMSIGDLLDAAFRLYRRHFLTFIGIAALLQVPFLILQALLQFAIGGTVNGRLTELLENPAATEGSSLSDVLPLGQLALYYVLAFGLAIIQGLVIQNLIAGALANAISRSYLGQPVSILGAYRFGAGRLGSLIVASLLLGLLALVLAGVVIGVPALLLIGAAASGRVDGVAGGLLFAFALIGLAILSILLAAMLLPRFLLATQAIVLEGKEAVDGLRRSWQLVSGSFWRVLGVVVLMGLIVFVISFIFGLPASILNAILAVRQASPFALTSTQVLSNLLVEIGTILVMPLQLAVFTLLYYDLRVRKEGYDLQLMAQQLTTA